MYSKVSNFPILILRDFEEIVSKDRRPHFAKPLLKPPPSRLVPLAPQDEDGV